jgi:hypothetical protein
MDVTQNQVTQPSLQAPDDNLGFNCDVITSYASAHWAAAGTAADSHTHDIDH